MRERTRTPRAQNKGNQVQPQSLTSVLVESTITATSEACVRASLSQDLVRRLRILLDPAQLQYAP
jgi:hypothetical protein